MVCRLRGEVEAIGNSGARLLVNGRVVPCQAQDHRQALEIVAHALQQEGWPTPQAIGHRVVHGGAKFTAPVVIDEKVLAEIEATVPLAPLHNPPNLEGIRLAQKLWPQAPQVAVFDTAFHQTLPPRAFRYAVPKEWYQQLGLRRFGFHGLSHAYVAKRAAEFLGKPLNALRLISLHLGNGASACAIAYGQSVDTSMGLTPMEGLVMGTRPGDVDVGMMLHLLTQHRLSVQELERALNFASGLKGLCGLSDLRQIHAAIAQGDEDAQLALEVFCYRVKKYLGAYWAVLGGADAIVFTGGIGENDPKVRELCVWGLEPLGITIDPNKNRQIGRAVMEIQSPGASIQILVIATDEEREIAENVLTLLEVSP